jgi:hypothetical protein
MFNKQFKGILIIFWLKGQSEVVEEKGGSRACGNPLYELVAASQALLSTRTTPGGEVVKPMCRNHEGEV